jgi:hypothetical protein
MSVARHLRGASTVIVCVAAGSGPREGMERSETCTSNPVFGNVRTEAADGD